jgi:hypothetical protein
LVELRTLPRLSAQPRRSSQPRRSYCGARSPPDHLADRLARVRDHLQVLAAGRATVPVARPGKREGFYLPREVFFGRLGFAGAFVPVCASDFGRFFPATSAPSG